MSMTAFMVAHWLFATFGPALPGPPRPRAALVLRREHDDPRVLEITARLCGELAADGFAVEQRVAPSDVTPQHALEQARPTAEEDAVLLITNVADPSTHAPQLELWLFDRLLGRTSMARLEEAPTGGAMTPAQLAVRAAELLRARLYEHSLLRDGSRPGDWQAVPEAASAAPLALPVVPNEPRLQTYGVSVGVGWLASSLGTTWLPVARVAGTVNLDPRLALDLMLSGGAFSDSIHVAREVGSASMRQGLAGAFVALRLRSQRWLEPSISLGAGEHLLQVDGRAAQPYIGKHALHGSPFVSTGLGARSPTWAHLCLLVNADLLVMMRPAVVQIDAHDSAHQSRASLLLRTELMVVF